MGQEGMTIVEPYLSALSYMTNVYGAFYHSIYGSRSPWSQNLGQFFASAEGWVLESDSDSDPRVLWALDRRTRMRCMMMNMVHPRAPAICEGCERERGWTSERVRGDVPR